MLKVSVYNLEGKEVEDIKLDPQVFAVEINQALIHQAVEAQRANARQTLAHAKGRAEVRGGGRKPWRQKGTGRARHGSTRSPIWKGGGVTFGPTNERNFAKKINKQMKRKAFFMSLTDKVKESNFIVVDKLEIPEVKTKKLSQILSNLIKDEKKSALLVLAKKDDIVAKSARNLPKTKTILADSLNLIDVLKYKYVIIDKEGVKKLIEVYKK